MHTLKFNATNIRHAPQIYCKGNRSRRGQIGLQVPRQPTAVAGKCTTLVRIKCIPNANPAFGGGTRAHTRSSRRALANPLINQRCAAAARL